MTENKRETYYEKNKEKIKRKQAQYQKEHREELIAYHRKYRAENRERMRKSMREYYQAHKEEIKAKQNKYYTELRTDAEKWRNAKLIFSLFFLRLLECIRNDDKESATEEITKMMNFLDAQEDK